MEKVIRFYNGNSRTVSEVKHKLIHGEGLKILTSKQMLQGLSVALAEVKAGNNLKTY